MDEIKVVPYIPDEDYDNPAMVVDFYVSASVPPGTARRTPFSDSRYKLPSASAARLDG